MFDQATELRKLVLRSVRETMPDDVPPPPLLVFCGGGNGVGVTTVAIGLSIALSGQGYRVVLIDADLHRPAVAAACGVGSETGITDVLAARRGIHEVLQPSPGGIQIVAGRTAAGRAADWTDVAQQRLLRQLKQLGRHADLIALDTGSGGHEVMRRFWLAADQVVLVTTTDRLAVTEAYAMIKRLAAANPAARLRLLVNQTAAPEDAEEIHRRIAEASERFLEHSVELLGSVPDTPAFGNVRCAVLANGMQHGESLVSRALDAVAARLVSEPPQPAVAVRAERSRTRHAIPQVLTQPRAGFPPIDI